MKKLVSVVVSACLFVSFAFAGSTFNEQPSRQHKAAHRIRLTTKDGAATCSGTAVSPKAVLTAHHCLVTDLDAVYIDEDKRPHYVAKVVTDDRDAMLLVFTDLPFVDYVSIVRPADVREAVQGERVYWWGNPSGVRDVYRVGYFGGSVSQRGDDIHAAINIVVAPSIPGDSGSNLYAGDGRLVGVLTYSVFGGLMGGYYTLHFSDADLAQAGL